MLAVGSLAQKRRAESGDATENKEAKRGQDLICGDGGRDGDWT